jgi:hypothetical protein
VVQAPQEARGLHLPAMTPEAPSGSLTSTWPSRAWWASVARSRCGLTEVASSGPDHSRTAAKLLVAEADGNRTRLSRAAAHTGFED